MSYYTLFIGFRLVHVVKMSKAKTKLSKTYICSVIEASARQTNSLE